MEIRDGEAFSRLRLGHVERVAAGEDRLAEIAIDIGWIARFHACPAP